MVEKFSILAGKWGQLKKTSVSYPGRFFWDIFKVTWILLFTSFFSLTETPSAVFSEESQQALEPSSDHIDFCSESTSLFFFLAKRTPVLFWHSALKGTLLQWCLSLLLNVYLQDGSLGKRKTMYVMFANSYVVNMPTTHGLRLPTGDHQMEGVGRDVCCQLLWADMSCPMATQGPQVKVNHGDPISL